MFFAREVFSTTALTSVAQSVNSGARIRSKYVYVGGGAAAEIVIFRRPSAGSEYFRIPVGIAGAIALPAFEFDFDDGLEVITASAAGDVTVVITYLGA
jgi:hypothetical protein